MVTGYIQGVSVYVVY